MRSRQADHYECHDPDDERRCKTVQWASMRDWQKQVDVGDRAGERTGRENSSIRGGRREQPRCEPSQKVSDWRWHGRNDVTAFVGGLPTPLSLFRIGTGAAGCAFAHTPSNW